MNRICVVCGSVFSAKTDRAKYCCSVCKNHSRFVRTHEDICTKRDSLEKEVIQLYRRGKKDKEIAKEVHRSVTWVRNTRVKHGLPRQGLKKQKQKEAHKLELAQMEVRFCKRCGAFFYPKTANQIFCTLDCQRSLLHQIHDIKRKRRVGENADDIPLDEVYRKYNGICYLCGGKCDFDDYEWVNGHKNVHGNYPSREHVIPLSKGGSHTWDNVKLAHIRCNSSKGVRCG